MKKHTFNKQDEPDFSSLYSGQAEDDQIDEIFRKHLSNQEQRPEYQNWVSIQSSIPKYPLLRSYLQMISRIAAVTIIGMGLIAYLSKEDGWPEVSKARTVVEQPEPSSNEEDLAEHSKLSRQMAKGVKNREVKKIGNATNPVSSDAKVLLEAILAEDDEFSAKIDLARIKQALQPLEPLPVESAQAMIGKPLLEFSNYSGSAETDLRITVPIQFIGEHEVEYYLRLYDELTKNSNDPDR